MNSVRKELQIFPGPCAWEHSQEPQLVPEGQEEPQEGFVRKFLVAHEDRSAQAALGQPGGQPLPVERVCRASGAGSAALNGPSPLSLSLPSWTVG